MKGRIARRILLPLLLALPGVALADGGNTGPSDPNVTFNGTTFKRDSVHQRPAINSKKGHTLPGGRTSANGWAVNSDPVVAENRNRRLYDKRNGQFLSQSQAEAAKRSSKYYEAGTGVTLFELKTGTQDINGNYQPDATGLNAGGFKDGRYNILHEAGSPNAGTIPNRLSVDVLRAEGQGTVKVGVIPGGVAAAAQLRGQATLIGLSGEYTRSFGDSDSINTAQVSTKGQAFVGAAGELQAVANVSNRGALLTGRAGAFVGGRAEGEAGGSVTICGVQIGAKGVGEVSYGLGAAAEGYMVVNWSTMTVKFGGRAAATLGLGAGVGGEVEISLQKVLENPAMAARCALQPLADLAVAAYETGRDLVLAARDLGAQGIEQLTNAYDAVSSYVGDTLSQASDFVSNGIQSLCFWCSKSAPAPNAVATNSQGLQLPRNSRTVVSGPSQPGSGGPSIGLRR